MDIDIRTLSIVLGLTSIFQVIALYTQYRINRPHQGLGWWAFGSMFAGLGFVCNALRVIPGLENFAILSNNILYIASLELLYVGVLRFFDQKERRGLFIGFLVLFSCSITYFRYVNDSMAIRNLILSVSISIISVRIAYALFTYKTSSVSSSANFLAAVFLTITILFVVRSVSYFYGYLGVDPLTPSPLQVLTFISMICLTMLLAFGTIIMVNQRLNSENIDARKNLEVIFNTSPDAVLITRLTDGYFVNINEGFTKLTGYTWSDVAGKSTLDINLWKDPADRKTFTALLRENGACYNFDIVVLRKNGSELIGSISATITVLNGIPHIISVTRDITAQKQIEAALKESEEKYRIMAENSSDVIWHMDANFYFDYISPSDERVRGFKRDEVIGQSVWSLLKPEGIEQIKRVNAQRLADEKKGIRTGTIKYEFEQILKDGSWIWTEVNVSPHHDPNGNIIGYHGISRDITDRKRLQEELQKRATTDELTKLSNRRHFIELAQIELKRTLRNKHPLTIVLFDIDNFKQINDTYGHATGDRMLIQFARTVKDNIREIDIFARFGGDEFVLLLPETSIDDAYKVVERIRLILASLSMDFEGKSVSISVSAGLSCVINDTETIDTLLGRADVALYQAKETGRNRITMDRSSVSKPESLSTRPKAHLTN